MRWQGRERYVVLDACFAEGQRFLATWQNWRDDPERSSRLHYLAVARSGLRCDQLGGSSAAPSTSVSSSTSTSPSPSPLLGLLAEAWPPLTPNLHRLSFDEGRVELLIGFGDLADWLAEFIAEVDEFHIDSVELASLQRRTGSGRAFKALARIAAPLADITVDLNGVLAEFTASSPVLDGVIAAGFKPAKAAARSTFQATYEPRFTVKRPPARTLSSAMSSGAVNGAAPTHQRHAVIIGAGLAGCAAAWALAEQGWSSTIIDRHSGLAAETSGNRGGLFHGIVNAQDGTHARFNRAAALEVFKAACVAIDRHGACGQAAGLLRLETTMTSTATMQAILDALDLPQDYVQAIDEIEASARSGLSVDMPGWWYPQGGWIDPAALARSFFERAGEMVRLRAACSIARLRAVDGGWLLLNDTGQVVECCQTVILANAGDCERLLGTILQGPEDARIEGPTLLGTTLAAVRGQVSMIDAATTGLRFPRVPVAGAGYVLPPSNGLVLTGASSDEGDGEGALRLIDHQSNLQKLRALTRSTFNAEAIVANGCVQGRVGWRCVTPDRLPLIGGAPIAHLQASADNGPAAVPRTDQPRLVPREPGLFVYAGLGSRGITWSALGARILASWVTGAPFPVEASLVDATDAARFVARGARKQRRE